MHIKQIIIQGFKSYKEQTVIEPFSPGTNVIVGRNGSGKSNFFAAIRFVLSDAYTNMGREERQALLHEGSGSAVMSAYVEIIFDNTDKRFSEPGDEVVIRRTIGLKKDEYSVDKKVQTRADVLKILETAGFAKENPFYIVPQGRVASITNMKENERLNLLKEIAGTNTYDDRRIQSLRIMADTNSKREKIDELLNYIKDRLSELEEEKDELRDFQDKDRERRCLQYARWHRLQEKNAAALEQIEEARQGGAGASTKDHVQLEKTERDLATLTERFEDLQQTLELLESERQQLDEDRKRTARAQAKAELTAKHLDETRHAREESQRKQEADLADIRRRIQEAQAELGRIIPEYEKRRKEEADIEIERDLAAAGRDRLLTKQTRSSQFKTKADRDAHLKNEINEITTDLGSQRANEMEAKEMVKAVKDAIQRLEAEVQKMREDISAFGPKRDKHHEDLIEARTVTGQLRDELQGLIRKKHGLEASISRMRSAKHEADKKLETMMNHSTLKGLEAIRRLKLVQDIPGAYGTLAELMSLSTEAYRLPVEQVAGNSLFQYVVDNEATGRYLTKYLHDKEEGRVTFMPLEQLRVRQVKMPRAQDAVPLISKIEFDPKYEKAFQQVFGRTVVCPNLTTASQYARSHGVDAITPDGDTANKRGAMTGGYIDSSKSRLEAAKRVTELQDDIDKMDADIREIKAKIVALEQKELTARGVEYRLETDVQRFEQGFEPLKAELERKKIHLAREREHLETVEQRLAKVENDTRKLGDTLAERRAELSQEFKKALSSAEERQLEEFTAEEYRLRKQLKDASKKRLDLEGQKKLLENQLESHLKPQEDQLRSQAFENSAIGGSGSYKDAAKELKKAQRYAAEVEKQIQENDEKAEEVRGELSQLEKQRNQKEQEQQELQERINRHLQKMEKAIKNKATLVSRAAEYAKNIRDLGILPEQAFGKYEKMKMEQIETRLTKVNEALKKYKHINKKAFDQYNSFTTQRDQLLKRRKELDTSQESIEELIEHLDQAKDEAIERTFKQVSKEFTTIFEQLVPAGHGRLVIQRKADRGNKNRNNRDESDEEPAGVENYTGVGISVSFNSKVMDEQQKIQQLSGGQKSLCALCLIFALQAAESSPFVIFDEVDANLDAQYRTAVASLLDSISKTQNTQFICTTFRPEIVLVADKCYGVTFHNKTSTIDCVPTEEALNFVEGQKK